MNVMGIKKGRQWPGTLRIGGRLYGKLRSRMDCSAQEEGE